MAAIFAGLFTRAYSALRDHRIRLSNLRLHAVRPYVTSVRPDGSLLRRGACFTRSGV